MSTQAIDLDPEEDRAMPRDVFMEHLSRVEWFVRTHGESGPVLESLGCVVDFVLAIKKGEGDDGSE